MLGRRISGGTGCISPDAFEVALKFQHQNDKECSSGPPYELASLNFKIYDLNFFFLSQNYDSAFLNVLLALNEKLGPY
ncbi:hypothetical protein REPUB_Repub11eG0041200 [Reevesia pubescens]